MSKTRVAVLFGGRSPEHDVSIVSGLQALNALDSDQYEGFPVYIAGDGVLVHRRCPAQPRQLHPRRGGPRRLVRVDLDLSAGKGHVIPRGKGGLFAKKPANRSASTWPCWPSMAISARTARSRACSRRPTCPIPAARTMASAILMDKAITKRAFAGRGIGMLPDAVVNRPATGWCRTRPGWRRP